MFTYFCLISLYLLCIISTSVCNICSTCTCSTTNEGPLIDCNGKNLKNNDVLNFELLMLNEQSASNKLILSRNSLITLPEHVQRKLKRLKSLDLSENLMKEVHTTMLTDLNALEDLNLSKNELTTFDDWIFKVLPTLLKLNLSYNHISTVEHNMGKALTIINFLDLSHNNISGLPNKLFESLLNLEYLDLSFNKIHSLENITLNYLNTLKRISLHNNYLTTLQMQMFPKSLVQLDSGYNLITGVVYETSEIKILNLEHNRLSEIDKNLVKLNRLEYLNVGGNMLTNFPKIALNNLKILDISFNNITSIPDTVSSENFPLLVQLNVSKNPIQNLKLLSGLRLDSLIANNISTLKVIEINTFSKLQEASDCINLTISNNAQLSHIHEGAFEHLHLCSMDLSNNRIAYLSPKITLFNNTLKAYNINLQGNPFKCNCSLQWILNDLIPKLYSTQPSLLNNLRCASPPHVANMRMVHWYGWKDEVLCANTSKFSEDLRMNAAGISEETVITFDSSPGLLVALGTAITVLSILIIIGLILTRKLLLKKRRINRKF